MVLGEHTLLQVEVTIEDRGMASNVTDTSNMAREERRLDSSSFDNIEMFYVGGVPEAQKDKINGIKGNKD